MLAEGVNLLGAASLALAARLEIVAVLVELGTTGITFGTFLAAAVLARLLTDVSNTVGLLSAMSREPDGTEDESSDETGVLA